MTERHTTHPCEPLASNHTLYTLYLLHKKYTGTPPVWIIFRIFFIPILPRKEDEKRLEPCVRWEWLEAGVVDG